MIVARVQPMMHDQRARARARLRDCGGAGHGRRACPPPGRPVPARSGGGDVVENEAAVSRVHTGRDSVSRVRTGRDAAHACGHASVLAAQMREEAVRA